MQKNTKLLIFGAVALTLVGGTAVAGYQWKDSRGKAKRAVVELLKAADTDKDEALSRSEFNALIDVRFASADGDKNGEMTKSEVIAAVENMGDFPLLKRRSGSIADRLVYRLDLNGPL